MGRCVEALECYEKAIKYEPEHGMALGNMGKAMVYYAEVVAEQRNTYLSHAYNLLDDAIKKGVYKESEITFENIKKRIELFFDIPQVLNNKIDFPGIKIKGDTESEK